MNEEYRELKREILELKTAKPIPGFLEMYRGTLNGAIGRYTGTHRWRITFKDVGDTNPPIVAGFTNNFVKYDSPTDTMEVFENYGTSTSKYYEPWSQPIYATRPIQKIEQLTTPLPLEEWEQVRDFYPSDMGTTPGWCLQNCRLGFHIYSGTYATAMADKDAQAANGTLHPFNASTTTPPDYIACPVYMYTGIAEGHVVVWDHGTIYSDGRIYPSFQSIPGFQYVYGWGELCDGARVVQRI